MDLETAIIEEKKYSKYGMYLFGTLLILQCMTFFYELILGYQPDMPVFSICLSLLMIFIFKYSHSIYYCLKHLDEIEEREIRKAALARLENLDKRQQS